MKTIPAGVDLAVIFPPDEGWRGACTTIADLSRTRLYRPAAYISKWRAVHLIMQHAFECYESQGHGNRAAKREAMIDTAKWFDELEAEAVLQDPDAFPRQYAREKNLNYHDL
jgi:hypothetical protein